jgi:hypothetical protein
MICVIASMRYPRLIRWMSYPKQNADQLNVCSGCAENTLTPKKTTQPPNHHPH